MFISVVEYPYFQIMLLHFAMKDIAVLVFPANHYIQPYLSYSYAFPINFDLTMSLLYQEQKEKLIILLERIEKFTSAF